MPSLILPCTFDDLPRDIQRYLQGKRYTRLDKYGNPKPKILPKDYFGSIMDKFSHPFDKILFPLELLAKPEYKGFIKETHSKSLEHLQKWQHTAWQDNERQLDSVPNGYRENGMISFRENQENYNKKAEEIRREIDEVFSGKRERTQEVRAILSKKEALQKEWFDTFLEIYQRKFGGKYHTHIIIL